MTPERGAVRQLGRAPLGMHGPLSFTREQREPGEPGISLKPKRHKQKAHHTQLTVAALPHVGATSGRATIENVPLSCCGHWATKAGGNRHVMTRTKTEHSIFSRASARGQQNSPFSGDSAACRPPSMSS